MSAEKQESKTATVAAEDAATKAIVDQERSEKILKAKELYSQGSRNFLVKSYAESADELSQVCALYEELYGELSDELGMPYLLYAKSLIALALDENKVIDVPDEEDDDDDDEDDDDEEEVAADVGDDEKKVAGAKNGEAAAKSTNGSAQKLDVKEVESSHAKKATKDEADSTENSAEKKSSDDENKAKNDNEKTDEATVTSTDNVSTNEAGKNVASTNGNSTVLAAVDVEKPSTSNGGDAAAVAVDDDEEENEASTSLQLAWEILELAAKIFSRQGLSGLSNLAEVKMELANIEFENNILDAARDDYEKALKIYGELTSNYRRAMAEIHYKIGLTYLMQSLNKDGAESLKQACNLIEEEISEIKAKEDVTEKDKNNIQDMEETKQEILAKIIEIEEMQAQQIADVRAALDKVIKPVLTEKAVSAEPSSLPSSTKAADTSAASSTSIAITSSSKPTDISHLIKRKKPEEPHSEAEAATASPAKRPAV